MWTQHAAAKTNELCGVQIVVNVNSYVAKIENFGEKRFFFSGWDTNL